MIMKRRHACGAGPRVLPPATIIPGEGEANDLEIASPGGWRDHRLDDSLRHGSSGEYDSVGRALVHNRLPGPEHRCADTDGIRRSGSPRIGSDEHPPRVLRD